jgi:hypothetical protein
MLSGMGGSDYSRHTLIEEGLLHLLIDTILQASVLYSVRSQSFL